MEIRLFFGGVPEVAPLFFLQKTESFRKELIKINF